MDDPHWKVGNLLKIFRVQQTFLGVKHVELMHVSFMCSLDFDHLIFHYKLLLK